MPTPPESDQVASNLKMTYEQLCTSYHAIDDFRGKLLALLPTGTGIFLVAPDLLKAGNEVGYSKSNLIESLLAPIGVFGFLIALGLFSYELYGIRKCTDLIALGKSLEGRLGISGQFIFRPDGVVFSLIDEPFAAGIIYPTVLAAWAFLARSASPPDAWHWAISVFAFFVAASGVFILWLKTIDAERLKTKLQKISHGQESDA